VKARSRPDECRENAQRSNEIKPPRFTFARRIEARRPFQQTTRRRAHVEESTHHGTVGVVLLTLPLIRAASFHTNQRVRGAFSFRCAGHIQIVNANLALNVRAAILGHAETMYLLHWISAKACQIAAILALTGKVHSLSPVLWMQRGKF